MKLLILAAFIPNIELVLINVSNKPLSLLRMKPKQIVVIKSFSHKMLEAHGQEYCLHINRCFLRFLQSSKEHAELF